MTDHCIASVEQFKKITRNYGFFNIAFLLIVFLELFSFLFFFSFFSKSAFLGLSIGVIFFTGFAYFVLLFYFQGKKPEQLQTIKAKFLANCNAHHNLAGQIQHLVDAFHNQEHTYYQLPKSFETLGPLLEKFSVWTYWKEVHRMKEMLLLEIIHQYKEQIRKDPTDLETHATLAQSYIHLANLYVVPETHPVHLASEMQDQYTQQMKKALEEYKIIRHFSPDNGWSHLQLALTYQALKEWGNAIQEYETLHTLYPEDAEVLYKLGLLYFQESRHALGLIVYQKLLSLNSAKAPLLISNY